MRSRFENSTALPLGQVATNDISDIQIAMVGSCIKFLIILFIVALDLQRQCSKQEMNKSE